MTQQFQGWNVSLPLRNSRYGILIALSIACSCCSIVGCKTTGSGLLSKSILDEESVADLDNYPPPSSVQTPQVLGSIAKNSSSPTQGTIQPGANSISPNVPFDHSVGNGVPGDTFTYNNPAIPPVGNVQIPSHSAPGNIVTVPNNPIANPADQDGHNYAQTGPYSAPPSATPTPDANESIYGAVATKSPPTITQSMPPDAIAQDSITESPPMNAATEAVGNGRSSTFPTMTMGPPAAEGNPSSAESIYATTTPSATPGQPTVPEPGMLVSPSNSTREFPVAQTVFDESSPGQSFATPASAYAEAAAKKSTATAWRPGSTSSLQ